MANSEENPPEKKPTQNQEALDDALYEIPFARPIWKFFVREGKAVKHGWVAVVIIVGVAASITHHWTEADVDEKLSGITNYFSVELKQRDDKTLELNGELTDAKHDRDHYQELLAPFEAAALKTYTNAPLDDRLNLFAASLTSTITNELSALKPKLPQLALSINGITVSNVDFDSKIVFPAQIIHVKKSDGIILGVKNLSTTVALHPSIDIFWNISQTNLMSDGWEPQPQDDLERNHWHIIAIDSIGERSGFRANTLIISTNFNQPTLTALIYYHCDNSIAYESCVGFILQ